MGSLTSAEQSVIIGSILGDGALRLQQGKKNALLEINHSIRAELYLRWKYQILRSFIATPPRVRRNGQQFACRFVTRSLPIFTRLYNRFYQNGKKRVPINLQIDALSLAVWFMDDGARSRSSYYLNTQQFPVVNQVELLRSLKQQHGLDATLNKDKHYYRIRIRTTSAKRFREIVQPCMIPWMAYKLTNDPVTTESKDEALLIQALLESNTPTPVIENHVMA